MTPVDAASLNDDAGSSPSGMLASRANHPATSVLARIVTRPDLPLLSSLILFGASAWIVLFWETIVSLTHRWNTDANYSHGYVVPVVSAYLLWQSWETKGIPALKSDLIDKVVGGMILLVVAILALGTVVVPSLVLECVGMLLSILGASIFIGGRLWAYSVSPAIGFLVFMVPWPSSLYSQAAFPLQLIVSKLSSVILASISIPVFCEGNLIHLPGTTMHVAQACSGLRQLTAFLAIGTCAALMVQRPIWYRTVLLLSAIPIAVMVNVLRVTATGMVAVWGDIAWTQGVMHTVEGLVTIVLGMGILMAEIRLLDWLLVAPPPILGSVTTPPRGGFGT